MTKTGPGNTQWYEADGQLYVEYDGRKEWTNKVHSYASENHFPAWKVALLLNNAYARGMNDKARQFNDVLNVKETML